MITRAVAAASESSGTCTACVGASALMMLLAGSPAVVAADAHLTRPPAEIEQEAGSQPMQILSAAISRPKARGDITLRAEISFGGGPPYRFKLRRAERGADQFNNRPRYDAAAYEFQKLFLDPDEYVVPPTVLRMMPLAELQRHSPAARPTFSGSDDVLVVLQYWLQDVIVVEDVYDPALFATDPVYARHLGQLNVLTHLIEHADSNLGNFLISKSGPGARVFAVDNGVAFGSEESEYGDLWRDLRINRLPADTIARLRQLDKAIIESRLEVLAQWELKEGHYVRVPPGKNLAPNRGVRMRHGVVQMGLTTHEILRLSLRVGRLLKEVDNGNITTF